MKSSNILVVEDNETMRLGIVESLKREGHNVIAYDNGQQAMGYFEVHTPPIVITDLKMEPIDGIELLQKIKELSPLTEVLLISAYGSVDIAVKAMQMGATDFLTKPFSSDELRIRVKKLAEKIQQRQILTQLKTTNEVLQDELREQYKEMVGASPPMQEVFMLINQVAREDSSVLIEGESGTGKELVARAIHQASHRSDKPFIRVNCGALNDNLLESELFGHEKGAFTGAIKQKKGRFELANGGTLFLDEIGDVSPVMQIKLLRVLQEQEFERVGGEQTISTDVRIITATNQNLQKLIGESKFREDLYYRLSVIPIKLPSLRERKEDIPLLIRHFVQKIAAKRSQPEKTISPEAHELFLEYSWPGNIRELENLIERLIVISPGNEIDTVLISRHLGNSSFRSTHYHKMSLEAAMGTFEKNMIIHALKKSDGIKNRAAKLLGIPTSTLYYKMEKFGLLP